MSCRWNSPWMLSTIFWMIMSISCWSSSQFVIIANKRNGWMDWDYCWRPPRLICYFEVIYQFPSLLFLAPYANDTAGFTNSLSLFLLPTHGFNRNKLWTIIFHPNTLISLFASINCTSNLQSLPPFCLHSPMPANPHLQYLVSSIGYKFSPHI